MKLGGSILTNKGCGEPILRADVLSRICKEIATFLKSKQDVRLIVLHGAGSFGHPLAHRYGLNGSPLDETRLSGMAETVLSMRTLNNLVTEQLRKEGLPAFPIQPNCMFNAQEDGSIINRGKEILSAILDAGGMPILNGEAIFQVEGRVTIASADALAVVLAKEFGVGRIIFASDVDGVYASFPPAEGEKPLEVITRKDIDEIVSKDVAVKEGGMDVTGEMAGKLRALLPLKSVSVDIVNGLVPGVLSEALSGKIVGTRVELYV